MAVSGHFMDGGPRYLPSLDLSYGFLQGADVLASEVFLFRMLDGCGRATFRAFIGANKAFEDDGFDVIL